jgi:hypothetical protein
MPAIRYPNANENSEQSAFVAGGMAADPDGSGNYVPESISYPALVAADANFTQIVTISGSANVQGPNVSNPGGWVARPLSTNTGDVYYMFHGLTKAAAGFPISVGGSMLLRIFNLSALDFNTDTAGNKIAFSKV